MSSLEKGLLVVWDLFALAALPWVGSVSVKVLVGKSSCSGGTWPGDGAVARGFPCD